MGPFAFVAFSIVAAFIASATRCTRSHWVYNLGALEYRGLNNYLQGFGAHFTISIIS